MGRFEKGNKIGHRFSRDDQPDNPGRKPKLSSIPADAREKLLAALYHVLSLKDQKTAADYLSRTADELPEFGYMIQVYARGLMGKSGPAYANDILDRILGKPKQTTENILSGRGGAGINIVLNDPTAAEGLKKALESGAKPRDPEAEEE